MSRFYIIFKQYIQYYLYLLIVLGILYLIIPRPFILGLMIGTCGSLVNTYIFESYLAKAQQQDAIHISTGNIWRYLVAIIACLLKQVEKNSHFHHTNYAEYLHTKIASPKSRPKHLDLNSQHNPVHQ